MSSPRGPRRPCASASGCSTASWRRTWPAPTPRLPRRWCATSCRTPPSRALTPSSRSASRAGIDLKKGPAGSGALLDSPQAQVFHLHELLDAVLRPLAADARFLDAAERRHPVGGDAGIDADDAVLERLGHPPDAADITGVEVGREAEFGGIGHGDALGLGREAEQRRHRTEGLVARHDHVGGDVAQKGRLEERATESVAL